jgi:hypothetical protein
MMWERFQEAMLRRMFGCCDETLTETVETVTVETVMSVVQRG